MTELTVYLEIAGLAQDEDGNPAPAGMKFSVRQTETDMSYEELTKNLNIPKLLEFCALDSIVTPDRVRVITPEEYAAEYGDE